MNYKTYEFKVVIKYKDLLNNQFKQTIFFEGLFGRSYKSDGSEEGSYTFDLLLKDIEEAVLFTN